MISAGATPTLSQLICQPLSSAGFAYALGERTDIGAAHAQLPFADRLPPSLVFGGESHSHIATRLMERESLLPLDMTVMGGLSVFLELIVPLPMLAQRAERKAYLEAYSHSLNTLRPQLEQLRSWEVLLQSIHFDSGDRSDRGVERWWPYAFFLIDTNYNGGLLKGPSAEELADVQQVCESVLGVQYQHPASWSPAHRLGGTSIQPSALTVAQEQIQRLEAQLVRTMAGSRALRDESLNIRTSSKMLMQHNRSMRQEGRALMAKNIAMAAESQALRAQNTAMVAESVALRAQNTAMAAESQALREQNTAMAQESSGLRSENDAMAAEAQALREQNIAMVQESSGLRSENEALQGEYIVVRAFLKGSGSASEDDLLQLQHWHLQHRAEISMWAQRIESDEPLPAEAILAQLRSTNSLHA